ncbi:putative nucleic acid-binding protein [Streptosporangium saharense]|uniref:Putative nucleic acid-binding protein n=1 Tax=Streptosporangium saharense TaxID=1706840 RepID=A0A7W7VK12_9ACTN|nr:putative nucleic acid-binding protein [Streptosporangium saharense]
MSVTGADGPLPPLVADAMVIHHFAKADRLDVLGACVSTLTTTHIVAKEVDKYSDQYPSLRSTADLEWLRVLPQDTDEELIAFGQWANLLGADEHNVGEASVFTAAEIHGLVAITDDRDATRVGRAQGLEIHGTVWFLTRLHRLGKMTLVEICGHVDTLRSTGMRLPCTGNELPDWASRRGLL